MPPKTPIPNNTSDPVKLQDGSNVAARKGKKVAPPREPAQTEPPLEPAVAAVIEDAPEVKPVKKRTPAKIRPKVRIEPQAADALPKPVAAGPDETTAPGDTPEPDAMPEPIETATSEPDAQLQPLIKDEDLWEQDNPVKQRLEKLRARNAILTEQIKQLKPAKKARGIRP